MDVNNESSAGDRSVTGSITPMDTVTDQWDYQERDGYSEDRNSPAVTDSEDIRVRNVDSESFSAGQLKSISDLIARQLSQFWSMQTGKPVSHLSHFIVLGPAFGYRPFKACF